MKTFLKIIGIFLIATIAFADPPSLLDQLVAEARKRTQVDVVYDGSYRAIDYPKGDVPNHIGVCTDVIVRAYRGVGIDLQKVIHEDIKANFSVYPKIWGLKRPDTNIDHRRVPNLKVFFKRHGQVLQVSDQATDYQSGDIVTWMLPRNLPHIGIVSDRFVVGTDRPKIIHNIGQGPVEDDILFSYKITGHYRYGN